MLMVAVLMVWMTETREALKPERYWWSGWQRLESAEGKRMLMVWMEEAGEC